MKFATLTALVASASAQCVTSDECVDAFGPGVDTCCGQLMVAGLPDVEDPNYGLFSQYIWGLEDGEPLTVGHTATLCLPKPYIVRHAEHEAEVGTLSAWENLQDVLDTVPGVDVAFGIDGVTEVADWVLYYGADEATIKGLQEKAGCLDAKFGYDSLNSDAATTYAVSMAAAALGVSALIA
mgnify:CR=1 FL=1